LSGRGLCDELITRPEESYRLCCVVVCGLETSRMGAPYIYDISRLRVNFSDRLGWVNTAKPRLLYPREREPAPIVQEAGRAPGTVWMGAENLVLTGVRSPVRPSPWPVAIPPTLCRHTIKPIFSSKFLRNTTCETESAVW